jgi:hypothetical protein
LIGGGGGGRDAAPVVRAGVQCGGGR